MGRPKKAVSQSNLERFHNELELVGSRTELLLRDKKGRSRSCLLCRRRKQKCDHKQPSCTTCIKACVKCIQPARYRSIAAEESCTDSSPSPSVTSGGVFNGIEATSPLMQPAQTNKSNADNEGGMGGSRPVMVDSPGSRSTFDSVQSDNNVKDSRNLLRNIGRPSSIINETSKDEYTSSLEKKVRELEELLASQSCPVEDVHSRCGRGSNEIFKHENILPPLNAGLTSKLLPLRRLSGNTSVDNLAGLSQVKSIPFLASDGLQSIDLLRCLFAKYNLKEFFSCDPAFSFDEQMSRSLLDTFFSRYQFKYPLIDEDEIYIFHDNYINNNIYSYSETEFHFACGRMWLLFSISGCLMMTTGGYKGLEPSRYFSKAFRHIARCGDNLTYVQQAVLLTLLVLYLIRTDRDSLVLYDIIKDAMFICRDKLHLNTWRPNDPNAHRHLRLFWCVYLLERMICVAVGKPYTITESEIDLPLFDEISFSTRTMNDPKRQHMCVHFINQSLILRRLESEFVETLQLLPSHQSKRRISPEILQLVRKYFHDLEAWRDNCSKRKIKNVENETLKLYFYRSVRLLIQPYLEFLGPEDRLFSECQTAAGQICQLFKIFHQKTVTGHSTPSVHTVFISGVTLIYCMCLTRNNDEQKRKNLSDQLSHVRPMDCTSLFSTLDDLKACSICLYVMTERSGFARAFRDTFDQLLNTTIGNLIERHPGDSRDSYIPSPRNRGGKTENYNVTSGEQLKKENDNGITPVATSRIFDTGKTEELSAIVDAPNVELEEENDSKIKQGALEQISVPKSLAHLLIKADPNGKVLCEGTPGRKRIRRHSRGDEHHAGKRHIGKKPCSGGELDWEMIREQARLQQHSAQQRLQANLHALIDPNEDGGSQNISKNATVSSNIGQSRDTRHAADSYGLDSTDAIIPRSKSTVSTVDIQNNRSPNSQHNGNRNNSENTNATLTLPYPDIFAPNVPPSKTCRSPQLGSSIFPKEDSSNMAATLNPDILLSTDARDMINDISAWTTDSFPNPINEKTYKGDFSSSCPTGSTELNNQGRKNITASMPSLSSAASHPSSQDHQKASMGFSSLSNIAHPLTSSTLADSGYLKSCGSNAVKLPSSASIRDFIVEEFWTVNDDYGFLT